MANLTNVAFLGTIPLQGLRGQLSDPQSIVDDYARIGATGSGSQIIGERGRYCPIEGWAGKSSEVEAERAFEDIEALQGQVVRVQDDFGRVFERVRIKQITASMKCGRGPTLPGGVQMTHLIQFSATVEVLP